jgi:hypothetical protein
MYRVIAKSTIRIARTTQTLRRIVSPEKYSVLIRRRSGRPPLWTWEIQRRPKPLAVRLYEDGFKSPFAAKLAGEKALRKFLEQLAKEQRHL